MSSTLEDQHRNGFVKITENVTFDKFPKTRRNAFEQAIELIQKYKLPCDVVIEKLPLARTFGSS